MGGGSAPENRRSGHGGGSIAHITDCIVSASGATASTKPPFNSRTAEAIRSRRSDWRTLTSSLGGNPVATARLLADDGRPARFAGQITVPRDHPAAEGISLGTGSR
jgi:hypothetical protein